ncbi:FKBP-type peptidyl-prolyl cis-trans isomerase [Arcanobacterium haemolyticum]|nr:FKBP-type peptidyl-prolyl cis-trans isomerase [Arcanobacterium haemolyticum]
MRKRFVTAALTVALTLTLAACGSDSATTSPSSPTSTSAQAEATPDVVRSSDGMPTVATDENGTPALSFPEADAPGGLQIATVEQGSGREIADSDYLVVDYIGYVWGKTEAFDSSYSRGTKAAFSLSGVVTGWKYTLTGAHVGDKVIVSIPAKYGYGENGNTSADIGGTDTIVFYIEIHDALNQESAGQADATVETTDDQLPVSLTGAIGAPVTALALKDGQAEPTEASATVIARGTGTSATTGSTLVINYAALSWDGSQSENSWTGDPASLIGPVSLTLGRQTVFDLLDGIPAGSRVLLTAPSANSTSGSATPAMAIVVDILDVIPPATSASTGGSTN